MKTQDLQFDASIPRDYDTYLGPFLFEPYARELARRIGSPRDVLETSCGTGISTEFLRSALDSSVPITATDVSPDMLQFAQESRSDLQGVRYEQADACALPYADESFDAVASQFGLMFVKDRPALMSEARRVLRPEGRLVLSVWDDLASNPYVEVAQNTIATFFEEDPPQFLYMPWGASDRQALKSLAEGAGFTQVELHTVPIVSEGQAAGSVARGLVCGNPTVNAVRERATESVDTVVEAVADALSAKFGGEKLQLPMSAVFLEATR